MAGGENSSELLQFMDFCSGGVVGATWFSVRHVFEIAELWSLRFGTCAEDPDLWTCPGGLTSLDPLVVLVGWSHGFFAGLHVPDLFTFFGVVEMGSMMVRL